MKRTLLFSVLLIAFALSGCSFVMKEYDDTNEKRINELTEANRDLENKAMNLERRIPMLNNQVEGLREENKKLKDEMALLQAKVAAYESSGAEPIAAEIVKEPAVPAVKAQPETAEKPAPPQPAKEAPKATETPQPAKEAPQAAETSAPEEQAKAELTPAGAKLLELSRAKKAGEAGESSNPVGTGQPAASEAQAPQAETKPAKEATAKAGAETSAQESAIVTPSAVKIKVLSGTGDLLSGQKMAKTLNDNGYKPEAVDLAPKPFDQNTVYYAKGYEGTAEKIRKILGGNTVAKPLSWNSEFEIIVVTGGR